MIGLDDIVQESHRIVDRHLQIFPVKTTAIGQYEFGYVQRTEIAGFIIQQGLFAAGVGGVDFRKMGRLAAQCILDKTKINKINPTTLIIRKSL